MNFSVGIIGLPNVGKSTLFQALTKKKVNISNYPFCTIEPNVGIVAVPDPRLEKISEIIKPLKVTPTIIEFVDIAGLVKNAHQGEGLGNQFLARIREVQAILHLVRTFEDPKITHSEGNIDPMRDIEIINQELIMKDLASVEKKIEEIRKKAKSGEAKHSESLKILEYVKRNLENGQMVKTIYPEISKNETNKQLINGLYLLTNKPVIYVLNVPEQNKFAQQIQKEIENKMPNEICLQCPVLYELEISELNDKEIKELNIAQSRLDEIIKACYNALDLITFYTIKGGKETRAWTAKKGTKAPEAGGIVHSDFQEKFIKVEIINWQDLIKVGSWRQAREKGILKTEGKDYIVQNGDILEFKI